MAQSTSFQGTLRLKSVCLQAKKKILRFNYKFINLFCYICKQ